MVIRLRRNVYQGVNAHLHSSLQNEEAAWEVFHSGHVTHIAEAIDQQLPPGYLVEPERSLQIREYHPTTGERVRVTTRRPKPDVTIYETERIVPVISQPRMAGSIPTMTLPAIESIEHDDNIYLTAVVIYEIADDRKLGKPVTWIELLSPTNKPPGEGYIQYREKRAATLQSRIALVEIDYLHETRSPISRLKSYLDRETGSYPYSIVVTNPRPNLQSGQLNEYGFTVDQIMPTVAIPLSGDESLVVDFGAVYNRTYESLNAYSFRVDYDRVPEKFDTYAPDDQKHILAVMERARILSQEGANS